MDDHKKKDIVGYIVDVNDITLTVGTDNCSSRVILPDYTHAFYYALSLMGKARELCQNTLDSGYEKIHYLDYATGEIDEEKSIPITDPDDYKIDVKMDTTKRGVTRFDIVLYRRNQITDRMLEVGDFSLALETARVIKHYEISIRPLLQYSLDDVIKKLNITATEEDAEKFRKEHETVKLHLPGMPEITISGYNKRTKDEEEK